MKMKELKKLKKERVCSIGDGKGVAVAVEREES